MMDFLLTTVFALAVFSIGTIAGPSLWIRLFRRDRPRRTRV